MGTADSVGIYRSSNNGITWIPVQIPGIVYPFITFIACQPSGDVYAISYFNSLYHSPNSGDSWAGVDFTGAPPYLYHARTVLFSDRYIFVAGNYDTWPPLQFYTPTFVLRSSDNGISWDSVFSIAEPRAPSTFAAGERGRIYAGISDYGLFRTDDYGAHWENVNSGYPTSYLSSAIDSSGAILVGFDAVYRSRHGGRSWERIGLEGDIVDAVTVDPLGNILVGTEGNGVFRSTNDGETWDSITTGLRWPGMIQLAIGPDGHVYGLGGGFYRSVKATTLVEEHDGRNVRSYSLQQNYPNPFNPTTLVSYSIPKRSRVRVQIFNLLGQLIQTLADDTREPGTYTITWEAASRPSGLYFYRMTAGEFVETKKAILLK